MGEKIDPSSTVVSMLSLKLATVEILKIGNINTYLCSFERPLPHLRQPILASSFLVHRHHVPWIIAYNHCSLFLV